MTEAQTKMAAHMLATYEPEDPARWSVLLACLRKADDAATLRHWVALESVLTNTPRRDIAQALGIVERERGWHD